MKQTGLCSHCCVQVAVLVWPSQLKPHVEKDFPHRTQLLQGVLDTPSVTYFSWTDWPLRWNGCQKLATLGCVRLRDFKCLGCGNLCCVSAMALPVENLLFQENVRVSAKKYPLMTFKGASAWCRFWCDTGALFLAYICYVHTLDFALWSPVTLSEVWEGTSVSGIAFQILYFDTDQTV